MPYLFLVRLLVFILVMLLFVLEHLSDAAQIVRGCDAEGEFEGTVVCCSILEATLAGNIVHRVVRVLQEHLCCIFCT